MATILTYDMSLTMTSSNDISVSDVDLVDDHHADRGDGVHVGDITDDTTDAGADRRGNGGDQGGGHSTK